MFIYKAILYAYMYGITELKKDELKKHVEKLQLAFPNTEDSRLDIEYCVSSSLDLCYHNYFQSNLNNYI